MERAAVGRPHTAGIRRRPVQRRGHETMAAILDAAAELLAESGLEGFSTNAIAARAGVNIATLYGYFADKHAILSELFERFDATRSEYLLMRAEQLGEQPDVAGWINETIDALVRFRRDYPGGIELRRAMATIPAFHQLTRERDERIARTFGEQLQQRFGTDPKGDALRRARVVILAGSKVLDQACEGTEVDTELVAGLKEMIAAYLGSDRLPQPGSDPAEAPEKTSSTSSVADRVAR
jgi:AcrR family transcriptional regulator